MRGKILVYGAAGYTGKIICNRLTELGIRFSIAGRNAEKLRLLAQRLSVEHFVFETSDRTGWQRAFQDTKVLINAAGPFAFTAKDAIEACLESHVHYLDISAEIPTYQQAEKFDVQARARGITLISGAGLFVAYDALVVHTAKRVQNPSSLVVAFRHAGGFSRGSVVSSQAIADLGNIVRENGELTRSPDHSSRIFDFGDGAEECLPTPLGGCILSFKSTGIPNIREYFQLKLPAQGFDFSNILALPDGPTEEDRAQNRNKLYVEVRSAGDDVARSIADLPSGYDLTPMGVVAVAARILKDDYKEGFQSPGSAYGESIIRDIPGARVIDL